MSKRKSEAEKLLGRVDRARKVFDRSYRDLLKVQKKHDDAVAKLTAAKTAHREYLQAK